MDYHHLEFAFTHVATNHSQRPYWEHLDESRVSIVIVEPQGFEPWSQRSTSAFPLVDALSAPISCM